MICLDTNAVIALLDAGESPVRARLRTAVRSKQAIAVSTMVLFELWYGVARSGRREGNAARIERFLAGAIAVLDFDDDDAREAGAIRAALEKAGTPIGPYDLLIAAQARRRDALLVTANSREFARVPGLFSEDWSLPL
jgi:tRNA(fMet)-specific endonuclease VapC